MKKCVAFISGESPEITEKWHESLSHSCGTYKDVFRVKFLGDMTEAEKAACEIAITANPNPADLEKLPNLIWVQSLWAGVEKMLSELPNAPFEIVRMIDPELSTTMGEAVLSWALYLHRDMPIYLQQQQAQQWRQHDVIAAKDRNIALLGTGNMGKEAARRLTENGFAVSAWGRRKTEISGAVTYFGADGFKEILQKADILICLLPLTAETQGLLNEQNLSLMPLGSSLINFARGGIVDHGDLIRLLDAGHLKHAVLDVFDLEPLPPENPLWQHSKVTVLPHISAPTNPKTASKIAADNIYGFFNAGIMPFSVDKKHGY